MERAMPLELCHSPTPPSEVIKNKKLRLFFLSRIMAFGFQIPSRGTFMIPNFYDVDRYHGSNPSSGVVNVRSANQWKTFFDASKSNNKLLVIQFTAPWCGPCRHMEPIMAEFAAKYPDVVFIKVDVDELMFVGMQFGASTLPAIALVKRGREVDKVVGVKKNELQNKIENHRN